jgi:hypothetical protein
MTSSVVLTYAVFCDLAAEHWTSQEGRVCATSTNRSLEPPSPYFNLHSCKWLQHVKCTGGEILSTYGVAQGVQLLFEGCMGWYSANGDDRVNMGDGEVLNTSEWLREIKYSQKLFTRGNAMQVGNCAFELWAAQSGRKPLIKPFS